MTDWSDLDLVVYSAEWRPYCGWHDDYRNHDRLPSYLPAMQQSRSEFHEFAHLLKYRYLEGSCLQLGLGATEASHAVFQRMFREVWTIDKDHGGVNIIRANTRDPDTAWQLKLQGMSNLDLLFIDAGHRLDDVRSDFILYGEFVKSGGIIAMHDALKRPTYENEIQVWQFVEELRDAGQHVHMIGSEIGIAWMVKDGA